MLTIGIGICWDWNCDMIGLGYAGIKIGICWDKDWDMLGLGL
jgi:hypothetical protein